MIEIRKLTKKYRDLTAVDNISFNIEKGDILGFLGRNGAGKSTTMRMITGYLSPTSGAVFVDGLNVFDEPLVVKKNIGYLPETPPVYMDMTVSRYLKFVAELKSIRYRDVKSEIARVSDRCGITHVSHRLIRNLSKGFRQRVGLAQALLGSPSVLILDEPTVGLDVAQIREVRGLIRELAQEHTVILSTHILPEVQMICNRVSIIHNGSIVANSSIENLGSDETRIRVSLSQSDSKAEAFLRGIDGVETLEVRKAGLEFDVLLSDLTLADGKLLHILSNSELALRSCHNITPTLEDIFLSVVSSDETQPSISEPAANNEAAVEVRSPQQAESDESAEEESDESAEESEDSQEVAEEKKQEKSSKSKRRKKKR